MEKFLSDLESDIDRNWFNVTDNVSLYNNFSIVLDKIIELNKNNRDLKVEWTKEHYGKEGYINYLRDFCTVFFDIGRQVGKTEYIKRNARAIDAVIVPKDLMKRYYGVVSNLFTCFEAKINYNGLLSTSKFENIYVDDFSFINNEDCEFLSYLYNILGRYDIDQTFILLG